MGMRLVSRGKGEKSWVGWGGGAGVERREHPHHPGALSSPNLVQPSLAHPVSLPSSLWPRVASLSELGLFLSMYLVWQLILAPRETTWLT